jgi:hypothetical protein
LCIVTPRERYTAELSSVVLQGHALDRRMSCGSLNLGEPLPTDRVAVGD